MGTATSRAHLGHFSFCPGADLAGKGTAARHFGQAIDCGMALKFLDELCERPIGERRHLSPPGCYYDGLKSCRVPDIEILSSSIKIILASPQDNDETESELDYSRRLQPAMGLIAG
jgi:hypothetical protein